MPTRRELRLAQQDQLRESFKVPNRKFGVGERAFYAIGGIATLAGLVAFFAYAGQPQPFDITRACSGGTESFHIHPRLTILLNGEPVEIPANIGVSPTCMRWTHTHDSSGTIHVEAPYRRDVTLGDFFKVWKKDLSHDDVLGYVRDARHDLTMTIDGHPSDAWENLVLQDGEKIVLSISEKTR